MGRCETNDAKRDLMARIVTRLKAGGWSAAQLAALESVTPGTVGSWARGESMGTNLQRAELANLPATPADFKEQARRLAATYAAACLRELDAAKKSDERGAHFVAENQRKKVENYRKRANNIAQLFDLGD